MTFELWILLAASFLGLIHLSAASFAFKAQVGNKYTIGARDEDLKPTGIAGRLYRAQWNFLETYPLYVVCTLIVFITNTAGSLSYWGACLYISGRIIFLPLYVMGIPWIRTFSWNIATLGLVLIGLQVFKWP